MGGYLFLPFAFQLTLFSFVHAQPPPPPPPVLDHYYLVLTWPPGFCTFTPCRYDPLPTDRFTIHGLWPVDQYFRTMVFCPGGVVVTDPELKDEIYAKCHQPWPNLKAAITDRTQHERFWAREYTKHGACDKTTEMQSYLYRTVYLYNTFHLLLALMARGIQPGNSYPRDAYENAIGQALGTPQFKCIMICKWKGGARILVEVRLCVDRRKTTCQSCLSGEVSLPGNDNCGNGMIKFVSQPEVERIEDSQLVHLSDQ